MKDIIFSLRQAVSAIKLTPCHVTVLVTVSTSKRKTRKDLEERREERTKKI